MTDPPATGAVPVAQLCHPFTESITMTTKTAETVTCGRIYYTRHPALSDNSEPGKSRSLTTLVDVATLLDDANDESTEERGYRGAASARAQIGFDDETFEDVDDLHHPALDGFPVGEPRAARKALKAREGVLCWDGHNHVPSSTSHLVALLNRMRRNCSPVGV